MSEHIPQSSIEYAALQREQRMAPKQCKIISIDWCTGRNFMISFEWNGETRRVNIAKECRKHFGKLTSEIRESVIEAAPKTIIIHTKPIKHNGKFLRLVHQVDMADMASWLDRVVI